jgi:hypothetical protein
MVTADLQMGKDGEAKQLVEASTGFSNFPYPSLGPAIVRKRFGAC